MKNSIIDKYISWLPNDAFFQIEPSVKLVFDYLKSDFTNRLSLANDNKQFYENEVKRIESKFTSDYYTYIPNDSIFLDNLPTDFSPIFSNNHGEKRFLRYEGEDGLTDYLSNFINRELYGYTLFYYIAVLQDLFYLKWLYSSHLSIKARKSKKST